MLPTPEQQQLPNPEQQKLTRFLENIWRNKDSFNSTEIDALISALEPFERASQATKTTETTTTPIILFGTMDNLIATDMAKHKA